MDKLTIYKDKKDRNIVYKLYKLKDGEYVSLKFSKKDDTFITTNEGAIHKMSMKNIKKLYGSKIKPKKIEIEETDFKKISTQLAYREDMDFLEDMDRNDMLEMLKD